MWSKIKVSYDLLKKGKSPVFGVYAIIAFGLICILFLPYFFSRSSFLPSFIEVGPVGDAINGIAGPFIAIAAAGLTFLAFWVQFKANLSQRDDIKLERFENKFYELLTLHRANVEEMDIANKVKGRKVFFHMFYEFRFIYKSLHLQRTDHKLSCTDEDMMRLSYKIFFCGIGYNPDRELDYWLSEDESKLIMQYPNPINIHQSVCSFKSLLVNIQNSFLKWERKFDKGRFNWKHAAVKEDDFSIEIPYYPFDGHAGRLGHYFRHLFQTVDFVVKQEDDFINEESKYEYLKILRSQLSNYEQLLLYYNAVSGFGSKWLEKKFFTRYRFIRNLPIPLADFGVTPEVIFNKEIAEAKTKGNNLFEWLERRTVKRENID